MSRAVVIEGIDDLHLQKVQVVDPGAHEVRVAIAAAGVCHSDLHVVERGGAGMKVPLVIGHEAAGVVTDVGDEVQGLAPGDHVIFAVFPQCGVCQYCTKGQPTLCVMGRSTAAGTMVDGSTRVRLGDVEVGQHAGIGAWSDSTVVSELSVVKVEPDISLASAALIGCGVVTGFGAAAKAGDLRAGQTVATVGCGGVGLNSIQAARIIGASQIIAVDTAPAKLGLARALGATDVVDASSGDAVAQVQELTGGEGVDLSLDFVGTSSTLGQALAMARRGGTTVVTGLAEPTVELSINDLVRGGRTLKGNLMGMGSFKEDFAMLVAHYRDGALKLDELVSQEFPLDQFADALAALRKGEVARAVLLPG